MSKVPFYAGVDFGGSIYLEVVDPTTKLATPLTVGPVSGVISNAEWVFTPALPALTYTLDDQSATLGAGNWGYFFDGGSLDRTALLALVTANPDVEWFLVIRKPNDTYVSQPLKFVSVKRATLAT